MTAVSRFTVHLINAVCVVVAVALVLGEHLTRLARWALGTKP